MLQSVFDESAIEKSRLVLDVFYIYRAILPINSGMVLARGRRSLDARPY